jgi:hypothetical protein
MTENRKRFLSIASDVSASRAIYQAPLVLADPSPCLRWLALRDLFQLPEDHPELRELEALRRGDPLAAGLLARQQADGSWKPEAGTGHALKSTALALARLGYLGFGPDHPAVQRAAGYLFSLQNPDGSWPMFERPDHQEDRGYDLVPLQTALPLRGLASCGYAAYPRAERAYEWLLAQRLPDGAWPTGKASGVLGFVAGYRKIAHSRWGCRSNTTGALICLALHPQRRTGPDARRALDLLLGRETRERQPLGFEVARLLGAEPTGGFFTFYARFDLALLLDLCARIEASPEDERVAGLIAFLQNAKGPFGLWEYLPRPQLSRWLTFDLLRSLARLDPTTGWVGLEPRTPFQAYPRSPRRF